MSPESNSFRSSAVLTVKRLNQPSMSGTTLDDSARIYLYVGEKNPMIYPGKGSNDILISLYNVMITYLDRDMNKRGHRVGE